MSQGSQDNSMDGMYIAAAVLFSVLVIQFFFGEQVAWVYVKLREAWLVVITSVWPKADLVDALRLIRTRSVAELTADQLSGFSTSLRWFMFPVWGGIFGWFAWRGFTRNPTRSFRRKLTRETLSKEMSMDFPWTLPVLDLDLAAEPIDQGPWSMALTPLQFARKYSLLRVRQVDIPDAEKLFATQLGRLWTTPERLNPYMRALFACFAAQMMRDTEGANKAMRELVVSITAGQPKFTQSAALFDKYANVPQVKAICDKHAYQVTVLIAMFTEGKQAGIFPPNHFLWLKPLNRTMWFSLNCVLRRTCFAEVAGVFSHYHAEVVAGRAIEVPQVKAASVALAAAIAEISFDPETAPRAQA
jgi:intracellular multiplication protein IcmP